MSEAELANIVRVIHESFRDTISPGDDELSLFGPGWHPEQAAFMEMIRGKDWKGFLHVLETRDDGREYGHMFNFMTPQAYHYFAPALLIFSMDIEKADVLAEAFLASLLPFSPERHQQYMQERLRLFSDPHLAEALRNSSPDEKADVLPEEVLRNFMQIPVPEGMQRHTEERISLFSDAQKHAVALAVDFFYRRYGVTLQEDADLVAYWAKWL